MIAELRWLHGVEWTALDPESQAEAGAVWLARRREQQADRRLG